MKKNTRKWCEYHKSPWHNTDECRSKKSLVVELKASESKVDYVSESNPKGGKQIIDVEPSATVVTTKVRLSEPKEKEEGECFFHSHMWVKGALIHFIVYSGSQKNLISAEIVKRLNLPTTPHPQPYTIGWHWKHHVVYESRPCSVIITSGRQLYRIPEVELPTSISLISARKCSKVISQTMNFIFFVIHTHSKQKVTATSMASTKCLSLQQKKVDGIMEEYRDIFGSTIEVLTHCQVKHPIDLTLDAPLPNGPVY
jgi:hypothetical protein